MLTEIRSAQNPATTRANYRTVQNTPDVRLTGTNLSRKQDASVLRNAHRDRAHSQLQELHSSTASSPHSDSEHSLLDARLRSSSESTESRPAALSTRPPHSYSTLIKQALAENPGGRMSVHGICHSIAARFEYYRICNKPAASWKVSTLTHRRPNT